MDITEKIDNYLSESKLTKGENEAFQKIKEFFKINPYEKWFVAVPGTNIKAKTIWNLKKKGYIEVKTEEEMVTMSRSGIRGKKQLSISLLVRLK